MENDAGQPSLKDLFPEGSRVLLTGSGKQFIERIGVEAARRIVLGVMTGKNIRDQTEPLTRQRVAQISGAMVAMFVRGWLQIEGFTDGLSGMAVRQLDASRKNDTAVIWPAQWTIGLTSKSVQNVLRGDREAMTSYIADFEGAIEQAAEKCRAGIGELRLSLGFAEDADGRRVDLNWKDITRLTTTIGSQTLTIRGSDKSMYGKLFERLVLGSLLTILGFERVERTSNKRTSRVFWLSDGSGARESDATAIYSQGKLARFDIGFIGPGNPEISKDKLSRYAREAEIAGGMHSATTFVIIDRLTETSKTRQAAERIEAEIIQMSMQYWPREVARRLGTRLGFEHPLQQMEDAAIHDYLLEKLAPIPIQDFLSGVAVPDVDRISELPEAAQEIHAAVPED